MRNITVSVDEETHRIARIRAAELDTSVSAMVRGFLRSLAVESEGAAAEAFGKPGSESRDRIRARKLKEMFADFDARGVGVRMKENLSRDELYDEAMNSKPDAAR